MTEPAYVAIAARYAGRIRAGELPPSVQLPSYSEIARENCVSDIVVRKAVELLQRQGLVRTVERRGVFVVDRPALVRVSPERQTEGAEATFANESGHSIRVEREATTVDAPDAVAAALGIPAGGHVTRVVTRTSENDRPISISDTYTPLDVTDSSGATVLDETLADRIPSPSHARWLGSGPGELVKTVHQRFYARDGQVLMVSDVSYPASRYDAFTFRMSLGSD